MMTTIVQRIARMFRLGRISPALRSQLEAAERIHYLAEGIWQTAVFKEFRAPGACCGHRTIGFIGFFIVTEKRLIAKARLGHQVDIDIGFKHPQFGSVSFVADRSMIYLRFDASIQSPDMSGQIELRLHVPDTQVVADVLKKAGAMIEVRNG